MQEQKNQPNPSLGNSKIKCIDNIVQETFQVNISNSGNPNNQIIRNKKTLDLQRKETKWKIFTCGNTTHRRIPYRVV